MHRTRYRREIIPEFSFADTSVSHYTSGARIGLYMFIELIIISTIVFECADLEHSSYRKSLVALVRYRRIWHVSLCTCCSINQCHFDCLAATTA
jgi:hypothetical protein